MFSHVVVGYNDLERSRRFYDALFAAMGGRSGVVDQRGRLIYRQKGASFMVAPPIDGEAATHANGGTIGFALGSPEQVHAWHEAGVAAGGTAIESPPGGRDSEFGTLYLAYLRDPDGNKLCGVHRVPAATAAA